MPCRASIPVPSLYALSAERRPHTTPPVAAQAGLTPGCPGMGGGCRSGLHSWPQGQPHTAPTARAQAHWGQPWRCAATRMAPPADKNTRGHTPPPTRRTANQRAGETAHCTGLGASSKAGRLILQVHFTQLPRWLRPGHPSASMAAPAKAASTNLCHSVSPTSVASSSSACVGHPTPT